MGTLSEIVRDIARIGRIYFTPSSKIQIDNILKYNSGKTFTDPLDIPNIGFFGGSPITLLASGTWPFVISSFSTTYGIYGAIPTIIVRELTATGVYKYRTDIQPVLDTIANTLTIDVVPFDGDITIKI